MDNQAPPQPLPLPAQDAAHSPAPLKPSSSFVENVQGTEEDYAFEPEVRSNPINPFARPTGPYFFYGTLMDPSWLSGVLNLSEKPSLRPAKIVGYSLKLWGPYPALVDGPTGATLEGMVYDVQSEKHGKRLAEYETNAYAPATCLIRFTDGKEPAEASGTVFKYIGNPLDIDDGEFDLKVFLQRFGVAS